MCGHARLRVHVHAGVRERDREHAHNLILFTYSAINRVTAWFRILVGLLIVLHLVTKFCASLDLKDPSQCSEDTIVGPYPEPASSSLHLWNQFLHS